MVNIHYVRGLHVSILWFIGFMFHKLLLRFYCFPCIIRMQNNDKQIYMLLMVCFLANNYAHIVLILQSDVIFDE